MSNKNISFEKIFNAIPKELLQYITQITSCISNFTFVEKATKTFDMTIFFVESKTEHQIVFQHMNLSYSLTIFNDNDNIIIEFLIGNTKSIDVEPVDNIIMDVIQLANSLHRIDLKESLQN
jgi:hypothetical protein